MTRRSWTRTYRSAALLALVTLAPAVWAACDNGLALRMQARLYPQRQLEGPLTACRAWPGQLGRSIVALPLRHIEGPPGQRVLDLALVVVQQPDNGNTERDAVVAHLYQPGALREGGAALQQLRIDTSRYLLAPQQRAFGLRAHYRGDALATPFASQTLRLYLPTGANEKDGAPALREVLAETEIERESGRWDLRCAGRFERLTTRIHMEPVEGQRWADLQLARTLTVRSTQPQADGQCASRSRVPQSTLLRLRFDGQRYGGDAAPTAAR